MEKQEEIDLKAVRYNLAQDISYQYESDSCKHSKKLQEIVEEQECKDSALSMLDANG